jgi:hypothetical protein
MALAGRMSEQRLLQKTTTAAAPQKIGTLESAVGDFLADGDKD